MKILFVRHGETAHNLLGMQGVVGNDAPLNEQGQEQARQAAQTCNEFAPVEAVYTSPFLRTRETATAIAQLSNAPLITTDELLEFKMGDWAHLKSEETKQLLIDNDAWNYSESKYAFRVPGGESWEDVATRVQNFLNTLVSAHGNNDTLVCVSHNATIRAAVGIMRGKPFKDWFGIFYQNGGVSAFDYDSSEKKYTELFINKVSEA
jgi:broad specificity phosphatase PhoE